MEINFIRVREKSKHHRQKINNTKRLWHKMSSWTAIWKKSTKRSSSATYAQETDQSSSLRRTTWSGGYPSDSFPLSWRSSKRTSITSVSTWSFCGSASSSSKLASAPTRTRTNIVWQPRWCAPRRYTARIVGRTITCMSRARSFATRNSFRWWGGTFVCSFCSLYLRSSHYWSIHSWSRNTR